MFATPSILWIRNPDDLNQAEASPPDVAVIACSLPENPPEDFVEALKRTCPGTLILVASESASVADAVRYLRVGAHDVVGPPEQVEAAIEAAAELCRGRREAAAPE